MATAKDSQELTEAQKKEAAAKAEAEAAKNPTLADPKKVEAADKKVAEAKEAVAKENADQADKRAEDPSVLSNKNATTEAGPATSAPQVSVVSDVKEDDDVANLIPGTEYVVGEVVGQVRQVNTSI